MERELFDFLLDQLCDIMIYLSHLVIDLFVFDCAIWFNRLWMLTLDIFRHRLNFFLWRTFIFGLPSMSRIDNLL